MPYDVQPPPFELGHIDFNARAFTDWLAGIRAQRRDLNVLERPQILLGAGALLAQDFVRYQLSRGQVVALVDNARAGQVRDGVPIIGDNDVQPLLIKTPDAIGILCCGSENAIGHFRRLWGANPQPLLNYFEVMAEWPAGTSPGHRLAFLPSFSDDDGIRAAQGSARRVLQDADSLRTLDALMLYRLTWDGRYIAKVNRPEKAIYFEPGALPIHDHEVFIDGGAFDGDTVRAFHARTDGKYNHIHAFELDPANAEAFVIKTSHIPNVTLHSQGLWSGPAELGLEHRPDDGSRVSASATQTVALDALDNVNVGAATLIKLDVEGAEVDALNGAAALIRTHKPKLAISAYHRSDDFVTLIDTVRAIREDYSFTLRHYSPILFDSVLYCI